MRWKSSRRSTNVQDRRGRRIGLAGGGIGVVLLALLASFLGIDPSIIGEGDPGAGGPATDPYQTQPADEGADFVSAVLGETEDTWNAIFREQLGEEYPEPTLVLFSDAAQSACGFAQSAVGPFYCPRDQQVYIDLAFFRDLRQRFEAPGDFAQAYVIAHEVGHHVQTVLGISEQVQAARSRLGEEEANALSVRQELQADCFAGIWAHHADRARQILEQGDVEEALNAASAIGDDRIQRQTQGYVTPESFTHGSSAQRARWFRTGLDTGSLRACDTFEAREL